MCRPDDYPPYDFIDVLCPLCDRQMMADKDAVNITCDDCGITFSAQKNKVTKEVESKCPACGEFISYCQGHGEIGDPYGHQILEQHDEDNHSMCHPAGCDAAAENQFEKKFERD